MRVACKFCMTDVRVLHRDADLLVLYKPAGLATTSPDGRNCLTEIAAQLDPSAPRLHASSRLDAEVTGLVTFARTTRAIEGLLAARRAGEYERYYLGLATGPLEPATGELDWAIDRDPRDPRKRIARDRPAARQRRDLDRQGAPRNAEERHASGEGYAGSHVEAADGRAPRNGKRGKDHAQEARTRYRVLDAQPTAALLLLSPLTGRTHQLRVHVARAGVPLLGDKHYGGPVKITLPNGRVVRAGRVMLHCARVRLPSFDDPASKLTLNAPLPEDFRAVWQNLGGTPSSLENALIDV
jgi:23S rRNA-/tRNA-specific pseudouridylate synthase